MAQVAEENKSGDCESGGGGEESRSEAEEAKARRHRRQVVERKLRESNEEFEADRAAQEAVMWSTASV